MKKVHLDRGYPGPVGYYPSMQQLRRIIASKREKLEELEALHELLHGAFHDELPNKKAEKALKGLISSR